MSLHLQPIILNKEPKENPNPRSVGSASGLQWGVRYLQEEALDELAVIWAQHRREVLP